LALNTIALMTFMIMKNARTEREVRRSTTIALALAAVVSGPLAAYAQTGQSAVQHHTHVHHYYAPHHTVHHHFMARNLARTAESTAAAQRPGEAVESPQPNQMFKPYANPGEGDADGLSSDPDDCMKGCIGGNPQ
jgi:hypothetical protein